MRQNVLISSKSSTNPLRWDNRNPWFFGKRTIMRWWKPFSLRLLPAKLVDNWFRGLQESHFIEQNHYMTSGILAEDEPGTPQGRD